MKESDNFGLWVAGIGLMLFFGTIFLLWRAATLQTESDKAAILARQRAATQALVREQPSFFTLKGSCEETDAQAREWIALGWQPVSAGVYSNFGGSYCYVSLARPEAQP